MELTHKKSPAKNQPAITHLGWRATRWSWCGYYCKCAAVTTPVQTQSQIRSLQIFVLSDRDKRYLYSIPRPQHSPFDCESETIALSRPANGVIYIIMLYVYITVLLMVLQSWKVERVDWERLVRITRLTKRIFVFFKNYENCLLRL